VTDDGHEGAVAEHDIDRDPGQRTRGGSGQAHGRRGRSGVRHGAAVTGRA
jgi:hypothetical protein